MRISSHSHYLSSRVSILCTLALATAGCSGRPATQGTDLLPGQLHGLQLVESKSGTEAAAEIARLHKQDVAPRASEVGVYESDGIRADLYVSSFNTPAEASAEFEAMVTAIDQGVEGYGHHTHFDVAGRDVHVVFGDARINYFYASDNKLTWLAVRQPMFARAALAELLGVALDSIPRLPGTPREQPQESEPS